MVHGAPDNYQVEKKSITFRLDDMAELAVRVGAIASLDRMGEVIFADGFESGLEHWAQDTLEASATIELSTVRFRSGGFACALTTPEAVEEYCYIARGSSFFIGGKIGFEFSFAGDTYGKKIAICIYVYSGTDLLSAIVIYDVIAQTLSYLNSDGDMIEFETDLKIVWGERIWNTWKLVIDIDDEEYVRLRVNQNTYSLADIAIKKEVDATAPYISVACKLMETQSVATTLYIDNCILTQNEP